MLLRGHQKDVAAYSTQTSLLLSPDHKARLMRLPLTWACSCVMNLTVTPALLPDQDRHAL